MLKAHFDGKVLIPDEPVDLPVDCALELRIEPVPVQKPSTDANPLKSLIELAKRFPVTGQPNGEKSAEPEKISLAGSVEDRPLMKLLRALEALPDNPDWPADGAAQHDHYLYGLPKRP